MQKLGNLIGEKFHSPISGNYFENINPATGEVISLIPDSDERDVVNTLEMAQSAFSNWASIPNEERAAYLLKIADVIHDRFEELAEAETNDNGKPLSLSKRMDIPRAAANFKFFASALQQFGSESYQTDTRAINYVARKPIGVVGCISPWNLPLYLFTWKIAPALAVGNCVIAKPSEITPTTATLLAEICADILPPGVFSLLHGYGHKIGAAIVKNRGIKAISFTGGTVTGRSIALTCAEQLKKVSLELGGKNPAIVFANCNFTKTVESLVRASFTNQGQICLCSSRILIEKSIYNDFKKAFVEKVKELKVGDPYLPDTNQGAVSSENHLNKIVSYIELAKKEGGTVLCGGNVISIVGRCSKGFFVAPTVIENLSNTCVVNQEEIFGPVVSLIPFETEQEAICLANETEYGLSATIWTQDLNTAHRVSDAIEAGVVWVNTWLFRDLRTPFGGIKNSGLGREGGMEALRFFTEEKNICIGF